MSRFFLLYGFYLAISLISCDTQTDSKKATTERNHPSFEKIRTDSVSEFAIFEVLPGSNILIGELAGITYDDDRIYITDSKQASVYVLDRNHMTYLNTIGTATTNAPGSLGRPVSSFIYQDTVYVEHSQGKYLYTCFSTDGEVLKTIPRHDLSSVDVSFDKSSFIRNGYLFKTVGAAKDGNKVKRYEMNNLASVDRSLLSLMDFGPYKDTSRLESAHPYLFVFPDQRGSDLFYAASGSTLMINSYDLDGRLQDAYDLSGIEELSTYRDQLDMVYSSVGSGDDAVDKVYTAYFNGIVMDEHNRFIYPYAHIDNMSEVVANISNPDIMRVSYAFAVVDIEDFTYEVLVCSRSVAPIAVIDDKLWCYDRLHGDLVIYQL